jgi:uncharacterized RDD family membrane protein YckC
MDFFIIENGKSEGPFTIEQLKQKKIKSDTMVWSKGFANWVAAENVKQLKNLIVHMPPPVSQATVYKVAPPPYNPKAILDKSMLFGLKKATKWDRFIAYLFYSILIALGTAAFTKGYVFSQEFWDWEEIAITAGIILGFSALCYPLFAGNIGHKIFGLKVIYAQNGQEVKNVFVGGFRELLKFGLGYLIFPYLWIFWDKKNQNVYDKMVGTYVVKKQASPAVNLFRGTLKVATSGVVILGLILVVTTSFYIKGVPTISDLITKIIIDQNTRKEIGEDTREEVEKTYGFNLDKTKTLNDFFKQLNLEKSVKLYYLDTYKEAAFSTPGNYIYLSEGIIEELDNYHELAAIMAHEYAHLDRDHAIRNKGREMGYGIIKEIFVPSKLQSTFKNPDNGFLDIQYPEEFEQEADADVIDLLKKSNSDPEGMISILKKAYEKSADNKPQLLNRIELLERALAGIECLPEQNETLKGLFDVLKSEKATEIERDFEN